ncbi:MAG TPA: aminoacyl-tRNA hydrolase [Firmicutes bacterium]|nr:aminoacyl-tRNA hydrolase [Candidatus Fermentithermobacillaceae bacterium]
MICVVGLGNPGRKYAFTRHNVGFMVVSRLAERLSISFSEAGFSDVARGTMFGPEGPIEVVLAKPGTYMNQSGQAVLELLSDLEARPENLLVVHDDMDLPFGRIRIRRKGSSGGHRGIESIISSLGTSEFPRLKVGIGRPAPGVDPVDYVLRPFEREETEHLPLIIELAVDAVMSVATYGLDRAMSDYNGKDLLEENEKT